MVKLEEKILASLSLASYLDTLGFKNGEWEFNYDNSIESEPIANLTWFHIAHHYFSLGGSNIDISKWDASDDTLLMLATARGNLKGGENKDYINEFIKQLDELEKDNRQSGVQTIKSLRTLKSTKKSSSIEYSSKMGGNGAAMRTSSLGLIYYDEKDIDKLIKESIESSRLTHNYPLGFLGGLVTALFTSYAVNNIEPIKWSKKLIKLYESGKIDKFMKTTDIYDKYEKDKDQFWDMWYKYNESRLSYIVNKKDSRKFYWASERIKDLLEYTPGVSKKESDFTYFGASGIGALIISYDSLLNSIVDGKISWDSLVFFSALHFGDNDSTGIICGAWYGALYGFYQINNKKMEELEFYYEIKKISSEILKKIN